MTELAPTLTPSLLFKISIRESRRRFPKSTITFSKGALPHSLAVHASSYLLTELGQFSSEIAAKASRLKATVVSPISIVTGSGEQGMFKLTAEYIFPHN